ncbi:MAG: hypothetical protein MI700_12830, partial [Balneolales bacterium]|nr:hypothetical protein [Balneolales bacterium]
MILKNIFGKTIEAARKTAQQMYGDDILILEATAPTKKGKQARITVFADSDSSSKTMLPPKASAFSEAMKDQENGVFFERSLATANPSETAGSSKLKSLRKFAKDQIMAEKERKSFPDSSAPSTGDEQNLPHNSGEEENTSNGFYNRSYSRPQSHPSFPNDETTDEQELRTVVPKKEKKFITHFKETKPAEDHEETIPAVPGNRQDKRELTALHKRFDRLESLLDSALISANLDYASHPVFQQLVQTGINTSVVARWFSDIIKEGVDPFDQGELFMAKIAGLIRDAIGKVSTREPQKFMLFAGPSGSGKTSMIMKLC